MKRYHATAAVVIAATALIIYVARYERGPVKDKNETPEKPAIFTFDKDSARRIDITEYGATTTLTFNGRTKEWSIIAPGEYRADQQAVDQLIFILSEFQVDRTIDENARDLKPYGLESPSLTVSVHAGGKTYGFAVGAQTPVGLSYFIRDISARKVFQAPSENIKPFMGALDSLRDKSITGIKLDATVSELSVASGGEKFTCTHTEKGGWTLAGDAKKPGCGNAATPLLDAVISARALEFFKLETAAADLGALPASGTITITAGGRPYSVDYGNTSAGGQHYVSNKSRREAYLVGGEIPKTAADFLDECRKMKHR